MSTIKLKVEAFAGTAIEDACRDLCALADRVGILCEVAFNGVKLWAYPGTDPAQLVEAWGEQMKRPEHLYRIASARPAGVAIPVRFLRWELAQTYTGTIYRVKDEQGQWVADFAEKEQANRFCRTDGVTEVQPARPLNGIPATWQHGEGAYAQCGDCGRYTLDPAALRIRAHLCECGSASGWSGSFKKPGPDAKWSGTAPGVPGTFNTGEKNHG
jgi:hypothetical protein